MTPEQKDKALHWAGEWARSARLFGAGQETAARMSADFEVFAAYLDTLTAPEVPLGEAGVLRDGCNYMAPAGRICNKCGHIHGDDSGPKWKLVPVELLDRFPEINPENYDHDDVCALNAWGVELVLAAAPQPGDSNE